MKSDLVTSLVIFMVHFLPYVLLRRVSYLGSTPIREMFRAAQKNSRVKTWMYNVPESELDDPTGEIQLLEAKVSNTFFFIMNHSRTMLLQK